MGRVPSPDVWYRCEIADEGDHVVSSVVCTLVLCIVSWAWYDWRVKKRDKKAETAENAGKQGR
jgi:hypothetical protein